MVLRFIMAAVLLASGTCAVTSGQFVEDDPYTAFCGYLMLLAAVASGTVAAASEIFRSRKKRN